MTKPKKGSQVYSHCLEHRNIYEHGLLDGEKRLARAAIRWADAEMRFPDYIKFRKWLTARQKRGKK